MRLLSWKLNSNAYTLKITNSQRLLFNITVIQLNNDKISPTFLWGTHLFLEPSLFYQPLPISWENSEPPVWKNFKKSNPPSMHMCFGVTSNFGFIHGFSYLLYFKYLIQNWLNQDVNMQRLNKLSWFFFATSVNSVIILSFIVGILWIF